MQLGEWDSHPNLPVTTKQNPKPKTKANTKQKNINGKDRINNKKTKKPSRESQKK